MVIDSSQLELEEKNNHKNLEKLRSDVLGCDRRWLGLQNGQKRAIAHESEDWNESEIADYGGGLDLEVEIEKCWSRGCDMTKREDLHGSQDIDDVEIGSELGS